jgi:GTP-binding protein
VALFENAQYFASAHDPHQLPPESGAEIAFVGRSNAGKSSAINTLTRHGRLAFVSKTPGRTQLINFFSIPRGRFVADLPGYGYAKVPPAVKAHWDAFLSEYLSTRQTLAGLVMIMDARHAMRPSDEVFLDWFSPSAKPVHVLLTKADKLSRNDGINALRSVREALAKRPGSGNATAQLFSSLKRTGVDEAEKRLSQIYIDAEAAMRLKHAE